MCLLKALDLGAESSVVFKLTNGASNYITALLNLNRAQLNNIFKN